MASTKKVRIAAVADIHCTRNSQGAFGALFKQASEQADILVLAGDLTDYGAPEEAHILAKEIASHLRIPVVAVLGNHDFEGGAQEEITAILRDAGVYMLDGDSCELLGIGFAGVKGFAGGFGRHALGSWGEAVIKQFVQEAVNEALKLETALARLRTREIVVVLHYAPIQATVEGEPVEIYAYLGSSRLQEPIIRYLPSVVFHGHAHTGSPEGMLAAGDGEIPIYNVALPLLKKTGPDNAPLRIVELAADEAHSQ